MTFELIERPKQARRFLIAEQADPCVGWLKANGFEVLNLEKGKVDDVIITIKRCALCDEFEGIVSEYQRILRDNVQVELRFSYVRRMKCMVRWEDEVAQ
jgi:hypothetical protein